MLPGQGLSESEILYQTSFLPGAHCYNIAQVRFHRKYIILISPRQPHEASFAAETSWYTVQFAAFGLMLLILSY